MDLLWSFDQDCAVANVPSGTHAFVYAVFMQCNNHSGAPAIASVRASGRCSSNTVVGPHLHDGRHFLACHRPAFPGALGCCAAQIVVSCKPLRAYACIFATAVERQAQGAHSAVEKASGLWRRTASRCKDAFNLRCKAMSS